MSLFDNIPFTIISDILSFLPDSYIHTFKEFKEVRTNEFLGDYFSRYHKDLYKLFHIISIDLKVPLELLLENILVYCIEDTSLYESFNKCLIYHKVWIKDTTDKDIKRVYLECKSYGLISTILMYKEYPEIYEYIIKNKIHTMDLFINYKENKHLKVLFIISWIYDRLFNDDGMSLILSSMNMYDVRRIVEMYYKISKS